LYGVANDRIGIAWLSKRGSHSRETEIILDRSRRSKLDGDVSIVSLDICLVQG